MRWARTTSSSRVMRGYWLISRRYWSSDPSSNDVRLAEDSCMARALPPSGPVPLTTTKSRRVCGRRVASGCDAGSVNQRAQPAPADVGQPGQRVARVLVIAEIDEQRPPLDGRGVHEPPVAGVRRIVPIVAHHKEPARRHE